MQIKKPRKNAWTNLTIDLFQIIEIDFRMNPIDLFIEQIVINSYCKVRKLVCSDVCFDMIDGSPRGLAMNITEYAQKTKKMIENKFFLVFKKIKNIFQDCITSQNF